MKETAPTEVVPVERDRLPTMLEITRACAEYFSLTTTQLKGERKSERSMLFVSHARKIAMFLCRVDARRSYPEIARFFDRDHTTVLMADRKIFGLREAGDAQLEVDLQRIRHLLQLAAGLVLSNCPDCTAMRREVERLRQELAAKTLECQAMRVRFGCD